MARFTLSPDSTNNVQKKRIGRRKKKQERRKKRDRERGEERESGEFVSVS